MSNIMGIGTITTRSYPYIPDSTRQFLASLRFTDNETDIQKVSEGMLSYLAYRISMLE